MIFRIPSLLAILAIAYGCVSALGQSVGQDQNPQQLLRLLPEPLLAGSISQQSQSFYSPDNHYEYMDGGADIFLLYRVRMVLHKDMRANGVDITVDVFDMGTADTAFGMYAAERTADEPFVTIGAEGYSNKGTLNFFQDRYYVKLTGFGDGADAALLVIARAISARIGTSPAFPATLARLPAGNRKPHSEQYMPNDPLGHAFLGPAYVAVYVLDGKESKVFITIARDDGDALRRFDQLKQNLAKTGQCMAAPELSESAIRASNSFEGNVIALTKGRFLVLLLHPTAHGDALLKAVAGELK
jgi:hypothetical protein